MRFHGGENLEASPVLSYENQGVIYMAVPVPHALGDYVIMAIRGYEIVDFPLDF